MANFPNFWRHKLIFYHFIFKNEIYSKFHSYLIFLKEKQLKTKDFYPKFYLEQIFLKVHYFETSCIIKSVTSKKRLFFIAFFVPKFSFIVIPHTCNVWFPEIVSLLFYGGRAGRNPLPPSIPPDLRNIKCPGPDRVKLSISAAFE